MLANTELEIKRRKNIKAAATEIRSVLKKYKITIQDIDLQSFDKRTAKKTVSKGKAQAKANDNRQRVKSKYANPNGVETWSGAAVHQPGFWKYVRKKLILPPLKRTPDL